MIEVSIEMAAAGAKAMVLLAKDRRIRGLDMPSRIEEARACLVAALYVAPSELLDAGDRAMFYIDMIVKVIADYNRGKIECDREIARLRADFKKSSAQEGSGGDGESESPLRAATSHDQQSGVASGPSEALGEIANRAANFTDPDAADWMPSIYKIACEAIGTDPWPLLEANGWMRPFKGGGGMMKASNTPKMKT